MNALALKALPVRSAIAAVAIVALALFANKCQGDRWQTRTDALILQADSARAVSDSARIASRLDSATAAAAIRRADASAQAVVVERNRAKRAEAVADRLRAERLEIIPVASQPGAAPTVGDTLLACRAQLQNCEAETGALRAAAAATDVALLRQSDALMEARAAFTTEASAASRLRSINETLNGSNMDLVQQLASADPPCRVLWMKCPTRTVVAGTTAAVTVVVTYLIVRK